MIIVKKEAVFVGNFECVSGGFIVSDPCYEVNSNVVNRLSNAKKGTWSAYIVQDDEGVNLSLTVLHSSVAKLNDSNWDTTNFTVGVDSGQAGVYDEKYFGDDSILSKDPQFEFPFEKDGDRWYAFNCDLTLSKIGAGIVPYGAVSASGYGDGGYECLIQKQGNEIVAVKIIFIDEIDEDEYLLEEDE